MSHNLVEGSIVGISWSQISNRQVGRYFIWFDSMFEFECLVTLRFKLIKYIFCWRGGANICITCHSIYKLSCVCCWRWHSVRRVIDVCEANWMLTSRHSTTGLIHRKDHRLAAANFSRRSQTCTICLPFIIWCHDTPNAFFEIMSKADLVQSYHRIMNHESSNHLINESNDSSLIISVFKSPLKKIIPYHLISRHIKSYHTINFKAKPRRT